ncbi:hypothetical protein SESBI_00575 [Sesbania bispinosa]|nr:hypothetical protein SESBI_00575 [Sesbania bispinosa]
MADGGREKISHSPDQDVRSLFRKEWTMVFGGIDGRRCLDEEWTDNSVRWVRWMPLSG